MVFPINVRRHFTVQKQVLSKNAREPKFAPRAVNDSAPVPLAEAVPAASSSSAARSALVATATSSTHSVAPSTPSPVVASSSSDNHVASTTRATPSATTSTSTLTSIAQSAVAKSSNLASSSVPSSSSSQVSSASTVPGTTFIAGPLTAPTTVTSYIAPTVVTTTSSVPTASPSTTAGSKNFLANTGAAAAVFTAVGLVGLALLIMVISYLIKRHRRARSKEDDDEYFEKIVTHSYDNSGIPGTRGLASLDPVHLSDPSSHANDMYNAHGGGNYDYTGHDYGLEYPPGTTYTPQDHATVYNTPGTRVMPDSQSPLSPLDDPFSSQVPARAAPAHVSPSRGPYEPSDPYY